MLRAGLIMFAVGLLWMASGWNSGGTALFGIVALLSMLSAAPDPVKAARQVSLGHIVAPLFALGCYSLLPLMTTFPLLVLCTLPFMVVILYVGTRAGWGPFGMALNMGFMVALMIPLAPHVDAQRYLNEAVAISIGALIALLGFILVPGVNGSPGQRRRLMAMLRQQVRQSAALPLHGLSEKFESRCRDLLAQVTAMTRPGSLAARRMQDWALLVHETGHTVIDLREALAAGQYPRGLRGPLAAVIQTLARLYDAPAAQVWHEARQQVDACLQRLPAGDPDAAGLRLLLLQLASALDDGDTALAIHVRRRARSDRRLEAMPHAA
jgi:uncharacterized membrane protein YccC